MKEHEIKIWPEYAKAVLSGQKTFELRMNDRNYNEGDKLMMREYIPENDVYTGVVISADVGFVYYMQDYDRIVENYCILSLLNVREVK